MSYQPVGPFSYEGGDPHARAGAAAPPPAPARMGFPSGVINQTSLYKNPLAQQALLARQFGINPGERSWVGDVILGDLGGMLRDYITFAGANGVDERGQPRVMGNASGLVEQFAERMRGNDFFEWIAGQASGFLNDPNAAAVLASHTPATQGRLLQNLTGMQTAGMNPLVSEAREQQVQGGLGQIALAQAERGSVSPILRFIAENPEYHWMIGR